MELFLVFGAAVIFTLVGWRFANQEARLRRLEGQLGLNSETEDL